MIRIENLSKSFGNNEVLKNINLSVEEGSIQGLVGVSGAGKSTILRCINGQIPYTSGSVTIDGREVSTLAGKELRDLQKNTAMIFQHFNLMSRKNAYDNIAFPMRCWKYSKQEIDRTVRELAEMVGIEEKLLEKPASLSGGQKQRVAIARALAMNPRILLSDEATSALDPKTAQAILELLKIINQERGITMIVVAHQMSVIRSICDNAALLEGGRIVASGSVRDLFFRAPKAMEVFLGKADAVSPDEYTVKMILPANDGSSAVPSQLSRLLDCDFRIVHAQTDHYRDGTASILTLAFSLDKKNLVQSYLNDHGVTWTDESNSGGRLTSC